MVDHDFPTLPQLRERFLATCRLPAPREFAVELGTNAKVFRWAAGDGRAGSCSGCCGLEASAALNRHPG